MKLSVAQLAEMIDHTLLKPFITNEDLQKHCDEAIAYRFKTVAINNAVIPFCQAALKGSNVLCDAAVSFPLGQSTIETKVFETIDAIVKGAEEVDYVVNLVEIKNRNWSYVEEEMQRIVTACNERRMVSKVIFETCYLTEEEKCKLCEVALKVKPTYIKTSTGFGTQGATVEDVRLMKACVGDSVKIKASGGVRSLEIALAMVEAGASRIGTSNGVVIIDQYRLRLGETIGN